MYDCAIIGTGAAGVSAALTLKALDKNIIFFGSGDLSGKIRSAEKIKNYPGMPAVSGGEMARAFCAQLAEAGVEITQKQVTGVYDMDGYFGILCGDETFEAKTVILATGVEAVKPVKGELELVGRGVSYCATCDGFLYRGKTIAIVCTSKDLEHEIEFLCSVAAKAYLFAAYKGCEVAADNLEIISGVPTEIKGADRVESVIYGGKEIAVDGAFMLKAAVAPSVLVSGLKTENGHVCVNRAMETNLKGCFAAGDCTGRPYQYAKAVGEGNVAAHSAVEYLAGRK